MATLTFPDVANQGSGGRRCGVLAIIATGRPGFELAASGFAANGFGDH